MLVENVSGRGVKFNKDYIFFILAIIPILGVVNYSYER